MKQSRNEKKKTRERSVWWQRVFCVVCHSMHAGLSSSDITLAASPTQYTFKVSLWI